MSSSPGVEEKSTGTPKQRRKDAAHHGKKRHTRRLAGRSTSLSNLSEAYQRPRSATVAGGPTPRTQGGRCAPPIRPLSAPAPSHSLRIAADDDSDPWSLLSDTKIDRSDWQSKALVEAPNVNELVARVGPFQRARDFVDVYVRFIKTFYISKGLFGGVGARKAPGGHQQERDERARLPVPRGRGLHRGPPFEHILNMFNLFRPRISS